MFTIRNIDTATVTSCDGLKRVIKAQLKQEIVLDIRFFDVGFFQGSNVVNIRNVEDLRDIIKLASGSSKAVLWCDGLREEVTNSTCQKRGHCYDSDDDLEFEDSRKHVEIKSVRFRTLLTADECWLA